MLSRMKTGFDWIGWFFYAVGDFLLERSSRHGARARLVPLLGNRCCYPHRPPHIRLFFTPELVPRNPRYAPSPLYQTYLFPGAPMFKYSVRDLFRHDCSFSHMAYLRCPIHPALDCRLARNNGDRRSFSPRFIIEKRLGHIDPRFWIALATLLLAISCFYTTTFDIEIDFERIAISRIIAGFGLALFLPPIFQILSECYCPSDWIDTFEIFQSLRNLSGGLGASIFTIIWERRSIFYHERLGEKLTISSEQTNRFFKKNRNPPRPWRSARHPQRFPQQTSFDACPRRCILPNGLDLIGLLAVIFLTFFFIERKEIERCPM